MAAGGCSCTFARWRLTWGSTSSRCHGWSSAPTYDLSAEVLGIKPVAPGYERLLFAPHPVDVEYADGAVPTPRGDVKAGWRRRPDGGLEMTLALPEGITGEAWSPTPGAPGSITINGKKVWEAGKLLSKDAVIFAQESRSSPAGEPGHIVLVVRGGNTYHITTCTQSG